MHKPASPLLEAEIGLWAQWAMSEALLEPNPMKNKKPNRAKSTS